MYSNIKGGIQWSSLNRTRGDSPNVKISPIATNQTRTDGPITEKIKKQPIKDKDLKQLMALI